MDLNSNNKTVLNLIEKGRKGIMRALFSRLGLIVVLLVLQVGMLFVFFYWFSHTASFYYLGSSIFAIIMTFWLINSRIDPTAKLTWIVVINIFPVFGSLLLLFTQKDIGHSMLRKWLSYVNNLTMDKLPQNTDIYEELKSKDEGAAALASYLKHRGSFPIYRCEDATYYPLGELKWEAMLDEIEKAEKFIFLEYFIIDEGYMWGSILNILAQKAAAGVDVRVLYDGTNEFATLPHNYPEKLEELGIKCRVFAPLKPIISTYFNYRDHRKILVVDGRIAFTGGINLGDEYINKIEKHGHWKDVAMSIHGEAVDSFTLMFLNMWYNNVSELEYDRFLGFSNASGSTGTGDGTAALQTLPDGKPAAESLERASRSCGYAIPYGDNPIDNEKVAEMVYIDILNRSSKYIHIMSPYLILDGEMETALKYAAERGTDVKLILPGIPDKDAPYALAKSHYASLIDAGVKIYEYTPGFVHAKVFVSDDIEAVVGTINLDYRSLYHHFECGCYMYEASCISDIEKDFEDTLAKCREITYESIKQEPFKLKILGIFLKTVAPLL